MSLLNFVNVTVRTARPRIILAGNDISRQLEPNMISFSYADHAEGKGDSIDFDLQDKDRAWIDENFPLKGAEIEAYITANNWRFIGDNLEQRCGTFTIDSVSFKGPPNTVSVKCNSIPTNTKIKASNTTRAWENTTVQRCAEQIAGENGMTVQWNCQIPDEYKRLEQMDQSDLSFLKYLADDNALAMKITDKKVVFFDEAEYEAKEPIDTIKYGVNVITWSFSSRLTDTCRTSTSSYQDPETGQVTTEKFTPEDGPNTGGEWYDSDNQGSESDLDGAAGYSYDVRFAPIAVPRSDWFDNVDEGPTSSRSKGKGKGRRAKAAKKAKAQAREKNKEGDTVSFILVGNPLLCAGKTVQVEGFGRFDGKYILQQCTHRIGRSGYTTNANLTKTLKGY